MNVRSVVLMMALFACALMVACEAAPTPEESPDGKFAVAMNPLTESPWSDCELETVLFIVNALDLTEETLKEQGVHTRAAQNIVAYLSLIHISEPTRPY